MVIVCACVDVTRQSHSTVVIGKCTSKYSEVLTKESSIQI